MIKAIIFDAEGVIIDTEPMWDRAQEEFLRRRGIAYDRKDIKHSLSGKSQAEAVEIIKAKYQLAGDNQALANERRELVRRQLEERVEFMPGFREFFERIRPKYRTAVATAMPEDLLAIVDARLGLSKLFAGHVYSLMAVGYRSKPNPDIFLHAANRLGVPPENCVVIEDAPHGVEAARRAGMKSIGLATTYDRQTLSRADVIVNAFEQIDLAAL
ncbi:MAG TPA: HAD family phosphatase [Candidatus Acidoferrum sp.]|nr:HAD family phosphatase [Candidatus Acidoferrum sp.]